MKTYKDTILELLEENISFDCKLNIQLLREKRYKKSMKLLIIELNCEVRNLKMEIDETNRINAILKSKSKSSDEIVRLNLANFDLSLTVLELEAVVKLQVERNL